MNIIPPKFYQICRLCLTVVSDSELKNLSIQFKLKKKIKNEVFDNNDDGDNHFDKNKKKLSENDIDKEDDEKKCITKLIKIEKCEYNDNESGGSDKGVGNNDDDNDSDVGKHNKSSSMYRNMDYNDYNDDEDSDDSDDSSLDISKKIYSCLSITVSFKLFIILL